MFLCMGKYSDNFNIYFYFIYVLNKCANVCMYVYGFLDRKNRFTFKKKYIYTNVGKFDKQMHIHSPMILKFHIFILKQIYMHKNIM